MSPSTPDAAEQHIHVNHQMFPFGSNPFLIWNAGEDFGNPSSSPWLLDHAFMPQASQSQDPDMLGQIPNPPEVRSPPCSVYKQQNTQCSNTPTPGQAHTFPPASERAFEAHDSPMTPERFGKMKSPVPPIYTQLETRTNTLDEEHVESFPLVNMSGLTTEPMLYDLSHTPPNTSSQTHSAEYSNTSILQEPLQFHSPSTRRTSFSSTTSGPVFSHYGTPTSTYPHESLLTNPYAGHFSPSPHQFSQCSPGSPSGAWRLNPYKGVPKRSHQRRADGGNNGTYKTLPARTKPPYKFSFSEERSPYSAKKLEQSRRRALSAVASRPTSIVGSQDGTRLAIPPFETCHPLTSPRDSYASSGPSLTMGMQNELAAYSAHDTSLMQNPSVLVAYPAQPMGNLTPSPTLIQSPQPSEPPASDLHNRPQGETLIYQPPHFEGDIYTPRFKRRNARGEWEGWCGWCQPGQWHNLKNSRYWDDKLRNHGICARTRREFEKPQRVRIVDMEGQEVDMSREVHENRELRGDEWVVSVDGSLRKRQGLCGHCHEWVTMDGARSKGKGKSVGWWNHAYKCHEQGKKISPSEQLEKAYVQPPAQQQMQDPFYAQQMWG